MSALGTATLDFGAWPGAGLATATVATAGIATSSIVAGAIRLEATADHTADEALAEQLKVSCGNIVANTSFDIWVECIDSNSYGQWRVDWTWC